MRTHRALVGLITVRTSPTTRDLAGRRELLVLANDPAALVVALLARDRPGDTREQ